MAEVVLPDPPFPKKVTSFVDLSESSDEDEAAKVTALVPDRVLVCVLVVWTRLGVVRLKTEEEERTGQKVSSAIWSTWVKLLGGLVSTFL